MRFGRSYLSTALLGCQARIRPSPLETPAARDSADSLLPLLMLFLRLVFWKIYMHVDSINMNGLRGKIKLQ